MLILVCGQSGSMPKVRDCQNYLAWNDHGEYGSCRTVPCWVPLTAFSMPLQSGMQWAVKIGVPLNLA